MEEGKDRKGEKGLPGKARKEKLGREVKVGKGRKGEVKTAIGWGREWRNGDYGEEQRLKDCWQKEEKGDRTARKEKRSEG